MPPKFNIIAVLQAGRLQYEAVMFMASLAEVSALDRVRVILAEPQNGPKWKENPQVQDARLRDWLVELGAEIVPFENAIFGSDYVHGNKILALLTAPKDEPFVFFDTDTFFTGPIENAAINFSRPTASMRREDTWPQVDLYGPTRKDIWESLYQRFRLDFEVSRNFDFDEEHWEHYLYFNAGWFLGPCPHKFADLFSHFASEIRRDPGKMLQGQALYPWLDQIALPLVITALGGGRPGRLTAQLDGDTTCHWRAMPLLYARESDAVVAQMEELAKRQKNKRFLRQYEPFQKMIYGGKGAQIRAMFDRDRLPKREAAIRKKIKAAGLWMR